jgi:hypothetical protein
MDVRVSEVRITLWWNKSSTNQRDENEWGGVQNSSLYDHGRQRLRSGGRGAGNVNSGSVPQLVVVWVMAKGSRKWWGGMVWWNVSEIAMQHPFWTPLSARSPALPYSGQRLAVGSPLSYCRHDVREDDAKIEEMASASKITRRGVGEYICNKRKMETHGPTEFGSTVRTLAYNANYGRVTLSLRLLELATFLGGHYYKMWGGLLSTLGLLTCR